jgi:cytochrome c peroxidase
MKSIKIVFLFISSVTAIAFTLDNPSLVKYSKVELGKELFNEKILSRDSSISCSSCHRPAFAFADTIAFSVGIGNTLTTRNTPSVLNMKNRPYFFWDGRSSSLREQALLPIQHPNEMGLSIQEAVKRLSESNHYTHYFQKVFHEKPNAKNISIAFEAYEKTLETVDSKFDDWSNNIRKLTPSEERGRQLFIGEKAKCFNCHLEEDFTDDNFKNIGLFNGKNLNDSGRFLITRKKEDVGKFKTPGLRNIAVTAPYMHNGMFKNLEQVIDYYNDTKKIVPDAQNIDPDLKQPLGLTEIEKKDLIAFLKTLTDKRYRAAE